MATRRILLLFLMSFLSTSPAAAVKSWCSQTPHPKPCEYFLTNNPKYNISIKGKADFVIVRVAAQLALDRCMHAKSSLHHLGPNCRSDRERAAWADCVDLYEETIHVLNKTVDPNTKCTGDDVQTWLSTALTNLDTCAAGFADFGIHDYHSVFPIMSNNVSLLVSNALALNSKGVSNFNSVKGYKDGFPRWVRPGHRKLLQSSSDVVVGSALVVVAQDGSGNFTTVGAAVAAVAADVSRPVGSDWYVIYVKAGTYDENVEINGRRLSNVMLLGDGIGRTIITGSRSSGNGFTTFQSATVSVVGDGFIAREITFRNTAGAQNQAVALRSGSDLSVFYQCSFEAYWGTLYAHSQRQFYRDCDIYGTGDMVFGNAAVVLQNCSFHARIPAEMINTVTAQGRTDPNQNTGTVIHNSRVMPTPELAPFLVFARTYLGRPPREYSRTVFMKTELDGFIHREGWLEWMDTTFALDKLYYAEYANTGPGSSTENRVKWPGYHVITNTSEAEQFAPQNFILVDNWVPNTNVPFTSGL